MASKIKVDQIEGSTGNSITIPSGQTYSYIRWFNLHQVYQLYQYLKVVLDWTFIGTAGDAAKINSGGKCFRIS